MNIANIPQPSCHFFCSQLKNTPAVLIHLWKGNGTGKQESTTLAWPDVVTQFPCVLWLGTAYGQKLCHREPPEKMELVGGNRRETAGMDRARRKKDHVAPEPSRAWALLRLLYSKYPFFLTKFYHFQSLQPSLCYFCLKYCSYCISQQSLLLLSSYDFTHRQHYTERHFSVGYKYTAGVI